MSTDKTGGPAFPHTTRSWCCDTNTWVLGEPEPGLTVRDYFAAKAMAAFIQTKFERWPNDMVNSSTSKAAYEMADAMLEARK